MSVAADMATSEPAAIDGTPQIDKNKWLDRLANPLLALLLAAGTFAVYARSLANGFISYDDPAYITNNPVVQRGLTLQGIIWAFTTKTEANWHPVTWLSHMLDVQIFGMHPAGHHLMNVVFHALNVVLLFLLLNAATKMRWRSLVVAAMFAVHPLNVESVAWIAERKSLISAAFFFLALGAYGWYVRQPAVGRYLVVALCFALGLMAKPIVITLPFVLLLLDYWPLQRFSLGGDSRGTDAAGWRWSLVTEKLPLLLLSLTSAAITIHTQRSAGAIGSVAALPLGIRLKNAIYSYLAYIGKGLFPSRLAVFYPHPENTLAMWKVLLAGVVIAAMTALVWRGRERRYLPTGWFWYLGTLVPVIGVIQAGRQAMADRYAYLPLIGLFVAIVWGTAECLQQKMWRTAEAALAVVVVMLFAICSYQQIGY